jgi:hypothetical protein
MSLELYFMKIRATLLFLILSAISHTSPNQFLLQTGEIVTGAPKQLKDNIVTIKMDSKDEKYPLYLFTPRARLLIIQLSASWQAAENQRIINETFKANFLQLTNFAQLIRLQGESERSTLILLDPENKFIHKLQTRVQAFPDTLQTLKSMDCYLVDSKADKNFLNLAKNQYKLSFPALIFVKKGTQNKTYSDITNVDKYLSLINEHK